MNISFPEFWMASGAVRADRTTRREKNNAASSVIHTARGMVSSCQLLLRHSTSAFRLEDITVSGLPNGVTAQILDQQYADIFNDGVPYPDKLVPHTAHDVPMNVTSVVWVVFRTEADAVPGVYRLKCCVTTSLGERDAVMVLSVHRAVAAAPAESDVLHEYFFSPFRGMYREGDEPVDSGVTPFYDFRMYSEPWWDYVGQFAQTLAFLRVNSLYIDAVQLLADGGSKRVSENEWQFDFSLFDRYVETFLAQGSFRYLTLIANLQYHPDGIQVFNIDENGKMQLSFISDVEEARPWVRAYFTAVYRHCMERGWGELLRAHLMDEPSRTDVWLWARACAAEYMPGIACGEPINRRGLTAVLGEACDFPILETDAFEEERYVYQSMLASGREVWAYTCCMPDAPGWLNKMLDRPHSESRILAWACFSAGVKGYLHWGFNFWNYTCFGITPDARFKGDGYVVYPDVERGGFFLSNRAVATAEGMAEWDLLRLLQRYDPSAAMALSQRIAQSFCSYCKDEYVLDGARAELLTMLDAWM